MPKPNKILRLICFCFFLFPSYNLFALDSNVLSVRGDYDYPPFEYLNEKKIPDGFNVDIMRAVAKAMDIKIHIELDSWQKVRRELKQGKFDALMGMFKTEERVKSVDFSTPFFIASYAVFTRKNSKIKSLKDAMGKSIIVEKSDLGYDYLTEHKITGKLILKDTIKDVITALSSGKGDCAFVSRLQGMIIIKNENIKNIIPQGPPVIQREYCIAVTKGNTELLAKINEGLSIIKTSGQYDKIYDKWFGVYRTTGLNYHKFMKYLLVIVLPLILIMFFAFLWVWTLKKQVLLRTRQLYQSRENINITLNSIGDAVIATDTKGKITLMNPVAEKLTGWEADKAKGCPLTEILNIVNAKTLKKAENSVDKVIKTGRIIGLANHTMLISKNGEEYQITASAAPIKDSDGTVKGIVLVFRDITQKYRMVEQLRKTREIFAAFMDYLSADAFIKDENLKFVFINRYMREHRNADTWIGKDLTEVLPLEAAEQIAGYDRTALETGRYEAEEYKPDANGIYRYFLTHRFPLVMADGKKFVGGIGIDISDRKKTERALKKSEEQYHRLVEATSEGFMLTDYENKIIDVNQSLCSMLGYSREEITGMTPFDLVDDQNYKIFRKQTAQITISLHRNYEISLKKKTGANFPVFINATTLMSKNEKDISSFAFITDLTEQKRHEKQLQKMEHLNRLGTLAGGIAHDFNNIMTGLFGNISLAKSRLSKDHASFKFLYKAEQSMKRATALTHQFITFAEGGAPVNEDVLIDNLVEEVIRFDLSGSNVKPVFTRQENLWAAKADKAQMQQVFSNLTINADQAMPEGGYLNIHFENYEIPNKSDLPLTPGKYVKITLIDEGTGIDKKDLDHIFDPYFTTKKTGSGLGLSTVYSIMKRHKGFIGVDTTPDIGTRFTLYLPAVTEPNPSQTPKKNVPDKKEVIPTGTYGKEKILVMDDEEMICEVLTEMLNRMGYRVETAADGEQAIEMYKKSMDENNPFDVIIMDLTIPGGMGGEKAVQDILAIHPKAVAVVSSGYADDPVMADYSAYGFKGSIAKPYTMDNLQKVLKQVMGR